MKKVLGHITIKYNKQSKKIYSFFKPQLSSTTVDTIECDNCEGEQVEKQVKSVLAEFFTKIYDLEKRDIVENPIKQEVLKEKRYDTGELKEKYIEVYYME